jgi:hypothetical protein
MSRTRNLSVAGEKAAATQKEQPGGSFQQQCLTFSNKRTGKEFQFENLGKRLFLILLIVSIIQ